MQVANGYLRVSPHPERAGPSKVYVSAFTVFQNEAVVRRIAVSTAAGDEAPQRVEVRRLGPGRFLAEVELEPGDYTISVSAVIQQGLPLRGEFDLDVPD